MSQSYASQEHTRVGEEIANELVRAFKVRRLYDPGHPQRRETEGLTAARIASLLETVGAVELSIESDHLQYEGVTVYHQPEGRESFAYLLHREGLRTLSLFPGLSGDELGVFLDEVAAAGNTDGESAFDLVARLWERDFVHIRYSFVETLMDEEWVPRSDEERQLVTEALVLGRDEEPVVLFEEDVQAAELLRDADPALYFLDDEDMALLQRELESEKERSLLYECLTCLRELLLHPENEEVGAVLSAVGEIQASYLQEGFYREVVSLHQVFDVERIGELLDPETRAALESVREGTLDAEALQELASRLDAGVVDDKVAAEYYRTFGRGQLGRLLAHCGDIKRLCQRAPVAETFLALAKVETAVMRAAIIDPDPFLACPAAYLAGITAYPALLEPLGKALKSEDGMVRREALSAIKQIGGPRSLEIVASAVEDEDPTIRLYALRHLIAHRYAPALSRVVALMERGTGWTLTEKRLLHEAYGALGGESVIDDLGRRLQRKGMFRKADPEDTACVLVALGATGSPYARALIEEATTDKHPLIQRTATEVLQYLGGPPQAARR